MVNFIKSYFVQRRKNKTTEIEIHKASFVDGDEGSQTE